MGSPWVTPAELGCCQAVLCRGRAPAQHPQGLLPWVLFAQAAQQCQHEQKSRRTLNVLVLVRRRQGKPRPWSGDVALSTASSQL